MLPTGKPQLTAATLSEQSQLEALLDDWDALVERDANANTFLTPDWLLTWLQAYKPAAKLMTIALSRDGQLVGLAPLMLERARQFGLPIMCLRFVGDGTFESDHMGFVTETAGAKTIHEALLQELLGYSWDVAIFTNVPEASTLAQSLPEWCRRNRLLLETKEAPCPARNIPASFEALMASLPSRFRTGIRSTRRKLADAYRVEFGLHENPSEFDEALGALFSNHESRWNAKGESGVFVNPQRREFYRLLTQRLHERGALRFFFLKLDGRIVAQEFCFAHGRTVYLLQEGFQFALAKQNIGNALRSYVFEHLIEQSYHVYDFLAGVSRHKQNWSDVMPNDVTFTVSRPSVKGRIVHYTPLVIEAAKARLRPLRDKIRSIHSSSRPASAETQPE